jgi:hypothetical protein
MYLINPQTGRKVNITSKKGKEVYKKYYKNNMVGGSKCKDLNKEIEFFSERKRMKICDGKKFKWKNGKEYECYYNTDTKKCTRPKQIRNGEITNKVNTGESKKYYDVIYNHNIPGVTKSGKITDLNGCQSHPNMTFTGMKYKHNDIDTDNAINDCLKECDQLPNCKSVVFHKWGAMLKNSDYDDDNDLESREDFTIYKKAEKPVYFYDEYKGQLFGNKAHGKGTMNYDDDRKQGGDDDKISYVGYWNNDLRHGKGTMRYLSSIYEGYWNNDLKHGTGTLKSSKKGYSISNGLWKNDEFIGTYKGSINKEGVPHGLGELKYNDTILGVYYGNFNNFEIAGEGELTKQNSIFKGTWINNKMNGLGKHTKLFGSNRTEIYEGPFIDDKYHGKKGKYTYLDGSIYIGSWINGTKNGPGIMKFSDENKYVGNWKNDKFNGKGTFHLGDDKNVFTYKGYLSGTWKNGWLKQGDWHVRPLGKWLVLKHIDTNITFAINPHYTEDEIDRVYQFSCIDHLECPGHDQLDLSVYFRIEPSSYMLERDEELVFTTQRSKKLIIRFGPFNLKYRLKLSEIISYLNPTLASLYGYGSKIIEI